MEQIFHAHNYVFNVYALPEFAAGAAIVCLGFFVLFRERAYRVGASFLLMCLSVGLYLVSKGISYAGTNDTVNLFWIRIAQLGAIFIPTTVLLLKRALFGLTRRYRFALTVSISLSLLFAVSLFFTDLFISKIDRFFWGSYPHYGPLGIAFIVFFFGITVYMVTLYRWEYENSRTDRRKKRTRGLFIAFSGAYLGAVDFLPALGIPIYPFGWIPILFFIAVCTYVVMRYQLVDITPEAAAREILEIMHGGVIVTDMEGKVRVANRVAHEMLGRRPGSAPGSDLSSIAPIPDDLVKAARTGKRAVSYETVWPGLDGPCRVSLTASLLSDKRDGEPFGIVYMALDITEQSQAEEALRKSEEKYRRLFDSMTDAYVAVDMSGRITECNRAYREMLGYSDSEIRTLTFKDLTPEAWHAFEAGIVEKQILKWDSSDVYEKEYRKKDGTIIPVELHTFLLRDPAGNPVGMWAIVRDITERKRTDKQIRQLANEQRVILDTIAIGIMYVKHRILFWTNPAFSKICGFTPEEAAGLDARRLYANPDDYERVGSEGYPRIAQGEVYVTEAPAMRKDGSTFWLRLTGRAVDPNRIDEGSIWMLQDISEQKNAETALKKSELLLRQTQQISKVGGWEYDVASEKFVWTAEVYRIYDVPSQFDPVSVARAVSFYATEDQQNIDRAFQRALHEGIPYDLELQFISYTGVRKWVQTSGQAERVEGKIVRVFGNIMDITERKATELALQEKRRQLEDLTTNLEHRVQREIALRYKSEQHLVQQSKLAAMGEMLGAIAHQWRQPLNALALIIQNLRDAYTHGEMNTGYIEQTMTKSMAQIQRMSRTIDDFRNFFLTDKDKATFNVMQAVGDVLALLSAQLISNNIRFRLICHEHAKTFETVEAIERCPEKIISGYRNEFEHVIMNLINNAREAIIDRHANVAAAGPERGLIKIEFRNEQGKIIITVADNGGGIDTRILDRIFEPYFTTKGPARGTGLGLYMSTVIIEDHMNGKIFAANTEQGAVFTIELPQT